MSRTIVEKIISEHAGRDVAAGDTAEVTINTCLVDDTFAMHVIGELESLKFGGSADSPEILFCLDKSAPASDTAIADCYKSIRQFALKSSCKFSDIGSGIGEIIINEQMINPGQIICMSSHTQSSGALGALPVALGPAELASAIVSGKCNLKTPATFKIFVAGDFPYGVSVFDLMLHVTSLIGSESAAGKVIECCGPAVESMSMGSRFALAGMASMTGTLAGLIASDETTKTFMAKMGRGGSWRPIEADFDASYEKIFEFNVDKLNPMVRASGNQAKIYSVAETEGLTIDQVYFGPGPGYGLEDWETLARIVRGKKKAPGVRFIVSPGSKLIERQVLDAGYFQVLTDFGAIILPPGYSIHKCGGALSDGERCLSTFLSGQNDLANDVYQGSAATIAASAIEGIIADPRKYEKELKSKAFPAMVRTEALKKIAAAAMESLELTASGAAKRYGPKLQETSDTVEKKAREVIKKYEPQARKAADELEKTIKNLAQDAKSAFKDLISRKKAEKTSKEAEPKPEQGKTAEKVSTKAPAKKTALKKTPKKKAVRNTTNKAAMRKVGGKKTAKKTATKKAAQRKTRAGKSSTRGN